MSSLYTKLTVIDLFIANFTISILMKNYLIFVATSKCHTLEDLAHVATYGFRGEGLMVYLIESLLTRF